MVEEKLPYLFSFKCKCEKCGNDNFSVKTEVIRSVWHYKKEYALCIPLKFTFTCKKCGNEMSFEDEFQKVW